MLSHQKKSFREQSCSSHKKDEDEASGSPSDSVLSDKEASEGDSQGKEDDHEWSGSGSDEISQDISDQDLTRNLASPIPSVDRLWRLACHPMSL